MSEKIDVKEIIKVGAILFVITALAAAVLGFVNSKTAPLIAENNVIKEQTALKAVMPDATWFEEVDYWHDDYVGFDGISLIGMEGEANVVKAYYAATDKEPVGVIVITETTGYDVGIQTVTGVDEDLKVTGVEIISMNETPGLGAKASDASFRSQYTGKSGNIGVSKSGATDTDIQAISGATKTSNGVTEGVNTALRAAKIIMREGETG